MPLQNPLSQDGQQAASHTKQDQHHKHTPNKINSTHTPNKINITHTPSKINITHRHQTRSTSQTHQTRSTSHTPNKINITHTPNKINITHTKHDQHHKHTKQNQQHTHIKQDQHNTHQTRSTSQTHQTRSTSHTPNKINITNTPNKINITHTHQTRSTSQTHQTKSTAHTHQTRSTSHTHTHQTRSKSHTPNKINITHTPNKINITHTHQTRSTSHTHQTRSTSHTHQTRSTSHTHKAPLPIRRINCPGKFPSATSVSTGHCDCLAPKSASQWYGLIGVFSILFISCNTSFTEPPPSTIRCPRNRCHALKTGGEDKVTETGMTRNVPVFDDEKLHQYKWRHAKHKHQTVGLWETFSAPTSTPQMPEIKQQLIATIHERRPPSLQNHIPHKGGHYTFALIMTWLIIITWNRQNGKKVHGYVHTTAEKQVFPQNTSLIEQSL